MNMNIFFMIGELPTPLIIMALGFTMWKKPPKFGEQVGYRTKLSQRSEQAWNYAQVVYGKLSAIVFAVISGATLLLNIYALIRNFDDITGMIALLIQCAVVIGALFVLIGIVEHRLKMYFGGDGDKDE